jgi:hypothetical protein|tara:strand:- start:1072 stop:1464 length:393 start_codon:yes stop_codon:yes gene_type:complete
MARNNYFNKGDPYSEWHRSLNNKLGYIDIDQVQICLKCKLPLFLAETTFDVGQPWKATTTTEALARLAGLPSFLIFYKVNDKREVIRFRIKQLTPTKDQKTVILTPDAWVQAMELIQDRHNLICRKKDAA